MSFCGKVQLSAVCWAGRPKGGGERVETGTGTGAGVGCGIEGAWAQWLNLKRFHVVILTNDNFFCMHAPQCVRVCVCEPLCMCEPACQCVCVCLSGNVR